MTHFSIFIRTVFFFFRFGRGRALLFNLPLSAQIVSAENKVQPVETFSPRLCSHFLPSIYMMWKKKRIDSGKRSCIFLPFRKKGDDELFLRLRAFSLPFSHSSEEHSFFPRVDFPFLSLFREREEKTAPFPFQRHDRFASPFSSWQGMHKDMRAPRPLFPFCFRLFSPPLVDVEGLAGSYLQVLHRFSVIKMKGTVDAALLYEPNSPFHPRTQASRAISQ